jgi:hypothetical protein
MGPPPRGSVYNRVSPVPGPSQDPEESSKTFRLAPSHWNTYRYVFLAGAGQRVFGLPSAL